MSFFTDEAEAINSSSAHSFLPSISPFSVSLLNGFHADSDREVILPLSLAAHLTACAGMPRCRNESRSSLRSVAVPWSLAKTMTDNPSPPPHCHHETHRPKSNLVPLSS